MKRQVDVLQGVAYVIDATERAGMVHSIAAVFADRGLSMDALVADNSRADPRIIVVFRGTPRQARMVGHVLPRLHDVRAVQMLALDSPQLRAAVLCEIDEPLPDLNAVRLHPVGEYQLLTGTYEAVAQALLSLKKMNIEVKELSRTVLAG